MMMKRCKQKYYIMQLDKNEKENLAAKKQYKLTIYLYLMFV